MASLVNMTLDFETTNNNHNNLDGLKRLAETIKQAGALACLQINHAGRFATGGFADRAIAEKKTDLIGITRVLWADPEWPQKILNHAFQKPVK